MSLHVRAIHIGLQFRIHFIEPNSPVTSSTVITKPLLPGSKVWKIFVSASPSFLVFLTLMEIIVSLTCQQSNREQNSILKLQYHAVGFPGISLGDIQCVCSSDKRGSTELQDSSNNIVLSFPALQFRLDLHISDDTSKLWELLTIILSSLLRTLVIFIVLSRAPIAMKTCIQSSKAIS